jgi:hypothetical protein
LPKVNAASMRPLRMDTLKDLSLENLYKAIHPKPPGLKEKNEMVS